MITQACQVGLVSDPLQGLTFATVPRLLSAREER